MVMKSPPVMIPLSGRVPERASEPSRTRVDVGGGDGTFRGFLIGYLGFSRKKVFIGERAMSVEGRGVFTTWQRAGRWGRGVAHSLLCVSFGLRVRDRKIGHWVFVSSNSKNIFLITFLKPKIAENSQLTLWHLVNRLVPENA